MVHIDIWSCFDKDSYAGEQVQVTGYGGVLHKKYEREKRSEYGGEMRIEVSTVGGKE